METPHHRRAEFRRISEPELQEMYERGLRSLLLRVRARRLQRGVDLLLKRANRLADRGRPLADALQTVYARTRAQVIRQLVRSGPAGQCAVPTGGQASRADQSTGPARRRSTTANIARLLKTKVPRAPIHPSADFHCDAALGGLARWLRLAGYDARWWRAIDDDRLLSATLDSSAVLLTTDVRLTQRGVIAHGVVPALLVPVELRKREQFVWVAGRLQLPQKAPRCTECGGRLTAVDKAAVRDQVPPRTWDWLDDYYLCPRCDKVYWEGTHWQRIGAVLADAQGRQDDLDPRRT